MERPDPDTVLFREEEPSHDDALQDLGPVPITFLKPFFEDKAAERTDVAGDLDRKLLVSIAAFVERRADFFSAGMRDQLQWLTVHGVPRDRSVIFFPAERVECPFGFSAVSLKSLFQKSGDRAF